jgi:hypothetical protein
MRAERQCGRGFFERPQMLCALRDSLPKARGIIDLPHAQQNLAALEASGKAAHRPIIWDAQLLNRAGSAALA